MSRKLMIIVPLVLALLVPAAFAQTTTTGAVAGRVTDNTSPVPGVTVELKSPAAQGTKVAVTDSNGEFRFLSLPPGTYSLSANLSGYAPLQQNNLAVSLNRTTTLELQMHASTVAETITVTAAAPVVDVTTTQTGANVTSETIRSLPMARDFYAVAQVAPGTSTDAAGTTVYGSTGAENQYIIDGLNTTGVETGTEGKTLNFDFIQEVQVQTGGLPAEYGRVTGGIINAITKSGGNEFTGEVFGYGSGGGLQSDNTSASDRPGTTTTVNDTSDHLDYGVNVGGYIVRDRLWFFGAYNRVNDTGTATIIRDLEGAPGTPGIGSEVDTDTTRDLYAGKLTWQVTGNHNISFSVLGDPSSQDGAVFTVAGPPITYAGTRDTGGNDLIGRYSGVIGTNWLINATAGTHHEEDYTKGPGKAFAQYIDQTVPAGHPQPVSGGFGFHQDQEFDRDAIKGDISRYFSNHEIKVGADQEKLSAFNANFNGGAGQRIYIRRSSRITQNPEHIYYRHRYYINDQAPGFDRENPATWQILAPWTASPETTNTSAYIQDSWKVTPNFTLNAGFRWEQQDLGDRFGASAVKLDDNYAPRVGVIWDVLKNGRSKLFGNYGRFFESIPMDINIRAFGGELQCFCYNFDPSPNALAPDPYFTAGNGSNAPARTSLLGGATPVDPDLKGQYIDELLLGYDQELAGNFAIGVQGTYRKLGRVVEDFLDPVSGSYHIANPGQGSGKAMAYYDYEPAVAPDVKRDFKGFEVHARKRFSDNAQIFASYLWSRLEGNYDGVYQVSTGQLDPNINSAFDYADFLINADGKLSNDRTHQFKLHGSYSFNQGMMNGLTLGVAAHYASGTPLNAYGYSLGYANYEYYLVPRGSLGRGPAEYEADLHVGYPVQLGGRARLNLLVDVFNVLNRQSATRLDERYNLSSEADPCAGIPEAICGPGGGILYKETGTVPEPIGKLDNPRATATNPDFLKKGVTFTDPRSIRFGVRLSF
ncbi:MAG TPA: TonB-dependent receptor [Thermoanaerobaculia bacterium]|nr:TonB-dependent receptor [Thermoanaerobaculia bacterium]